MVEFGGEFILESYRIPWLIWIQLLVMILLVILLYFGFAAFNSDPSTAFASSSSAAAADTAPPLQLDKPSSSNNPRRTKIISLDFGRNFSRLCSSWLYYKKFIFKEDRKLKMGAGTSGGPIREDEIEDETSLKESAFLKMFRSPNHPCNFLGHCKHAFLKCLGLDSSPDSSRNHPHDKHQ